MEEVEPLEPQISNEKDVRLKVLNRILVNLEDPDAYAKFSKLKVSHGLSPIYDMDSCCLMTQKKPLLSHLGHLLTTGGSCSQAASEKAQCSDEICQILSAFDLLLICLFVTFTSPVPLQLFRPDLTEAVLLTIGFQEALQLQELLQQNQCYHRPGRRLLGVGSAECRGWTVPTFSLAFFRFW